MSYQLEVCIDNIESLHCATEGGADRIELCSSLELGGLTPSYGMMKQAAALSSVPVYTMIRPRQGDFIFNEDEVLIMLDDIQTTADAGLNGVVLGVLLANGEINMPVMQRLTGKAHSLNLGITFHRAIDQTNDFKRALENIIELGCERVLTSGLAAKAEDGVDVLKQMVELTKNRLTIMAGAGVNADNAPLIINNGHISSLHLSGKATRASQMQTTSSVYMGSNSIDDFIIPITSTEKIKAIKQKLQTLTAKTK